MIKIKGPKELCIPDSFGSNQVTYGGNQIPCANLWDFIGSCMAKNVTVPTGKLLQIAEEADIFRWKNQRILVHTLKPLAEDKHLYGLVYWRDERQRIRPLVEKFGIVIAKIESDRKVYAVKELHEVCQQKRLYPVGMVNNKIYYAPDPERVFQAFGSRDWVRIGVLMKRPGSNFVKISTM